MNRSATWLNEQDGSDLPKLSVNGLLTEPIVQGGMGVGISIAELAGAVAREGGIGTLSSVGLAHTPRYEELYENNILEAKIKKAGIKAAGLSRNKIIKKLEELKIKLTGDEMNEVFRSTNIDCIWKEVRKAKEIANGNGQVWLNMMVAANDYAAQVKNACEAGIDGIVSGAGLPTSLPEYTKDYPDVALIPILSNAQGVSIIIRKWWKKYKRLPDAIVLEDPSTAGGHLGANHTDKVNDEETRLETSVPATIQVIKELLIQFQEENPTLDLPTSIPIIAAGGATSRADIDRLLVLGASGIQMGTRFLASEESGASPEFKNAIIGAKLPEDIMVYVSSAMLPARAIAKSGIFEAIKGIKANVRGCVFNCLGHCAYRDCCEKNPAKETPAQMCILRALVNATAGNSHQSDKALFFTGTSALQINTIRSVKNIMDSLKKGE